MQFFFYYVVITIVLLVRAKKIAVLFSIHAAICLVFNSMSDEMATEKKRTKILIQMTTHPKSRNKRWSRVSSFMF